MPRDSRTPSGAKPAKHISNRWPGAGSAGVRKAIVTNRSKKIKVTLAKTGQPKNAD